MKVHGFDEQQATLERVMRRKDLVRLRRAPKHAQDLDGYVVGVGAKWALLATVRDGGYLDGWSAVRITDVERIVDRTTTSFERRVSEQQPWWPGTLTLPLDLDRTIDLLRGIPADELVGIEKEHERSATWIGRIDELEPGKVWLHQVDPVAEWHPEALSYRLGAVTCIRLRSEYLTALASVTPEP